MIGGIFPEENYQIHSPIEKVPPFYLRNKRQFETSVGLDFDNRLSKSSLFYGEIIILASFCELVGPVPLLVLPPNDQLQLSEEIFDSLVVQCMSADYQACEQGDYVFNTTTQNLNMDAPIAHFVFYFTLWDIEARGYVRPCCIIVCSSDRTRIKHLFQTLYQDIKQFLESIMTNNIHHFYLELQHNLKTVTQMMSLCERGQLEETDNIKMVQLKHMANEFTELIFKIRNSYGEISLTDNDYDIVINTNFNTNCGRRQLRVIYDIIEVEEKEFDSKFDGLLSKIQSTETPRLFSLPNKHKLKDSFSINEDSLYFENAEFQWSSLKQERMKYCWIEYFHSAINLDRSSSFDKNSIKSPHCCHDEPMIDQMESKEDQIRSNTNYLFPELVNFNGYQSPFISKLCKRLESNVIVKLLSCLFSQCHLIILVDSQQSYYCLMRFLQLFLTKPHITYYFSVKNDWPTISQLNESPVTLLRRDSSKLSIPSNLEKFVAVYDDTTNNFIRPPKYDKGYITNFVDSFKALGYDNNNLDILINVMLLSYIDLTYQWLSLLTKCDRRRIIEYLLVTLGNSQDDICIAEKLALYVLQRLVTIGLEFNPSIEDEDKSTVKSCPIGIEIKRISSFEIEDDYDHYNRPNLLLTAPSIFNLQSFKSNFCRPRDTK